jgi:hypothetical protein
MKTTLQQHNQFLARQPLPGVLFAHNALVEVVSGEYVGDTGSVISVEELGNDPLLLVELERGDAHIRQSNLRAGIKGRKGKGVKPASASAQSGDDRVPNPVPFVPGQ